eukprot:CAMPEP_0194338972 /NCGR_PEP_ID=MMETSP0171-20130528/81390_1 /TAXON_ID=218684 /ORGANISM="Corethron pennatum, Strain L29A3" /LENGTH=158 /DNA_ID=CAMNT_0039103311 /DNA_START=308 /DNA_END=781 /DNA_ORIENTATION=+
MDKSQAKSNPRLRPDGISGSRMLPKFDRGTLARLQILEIEFVVPSPGVEDFKQLFFGLASGYATGRTIGPTVCVLLHITVTVFVVGPSQEGIHDIFVHHKILAHDFQILEFHFSLRHANVHVHSHALVDLHGRGIRDGLQYATALFQAPPAPEDGRHE